jgi:hypothetical protein
VSFGAVKGLYIVTEVSEMALCSGVYEDPEAMSGEESF